MHARESFAIDASIPPAPIHAANVRRQQCWTSASLTAHLA